MDNKQKRAVDSLQRVHDFFAALPSETAPKNVAGPIATLAEVLAGLDSLAVAQEAGQRSVRSGTRRKEALRAALRVGHMLPIAQIARTLRREEPGMDQLMKVPKTLADSRTLIAAAGAMANAAEPRTALLTAHGLTDDFGAQLRAAAAALQSAIDEGARAGGQHTGATAGIRQELARGRRAVTVLDAVVRRTWHADARMLAAWRTAKRIEKPSGGATTGGDVAPVPVTTTTTPATTAPPSTTPAPLPVAA